MPVTPVSEWRKAREGVEVELPSGKIARVRNVDVDFFVKMGRIPNTLEEFVSENFIQQGTIALPELKGLQGARDYMAILDAVVELCFVEPRIAVGREPGPDEITLEDVALEDKVALMDLLGMPAAELATFRPKPLGDVEPVGDPTQNGHSDEPALESERVGQ